MISLDVRRLAYLGSCIALACIIIFDRSLDSNAALNIVYSYAFLTFVLSNAFTINHGISALPQVPVESAAGGAAPYSSSIEKKKT